MAVRLAEENMDDMKSKSILMIGTGEVATLVAKSLARRGYDFWVASRTVRRGGGLLRNGGRKAGQV